MPVASPAEGPVGTEELVYPEPPWLRAGQGGLAGAWRLFGPGAIIASVSIASGETLFASKTGALFGYSLLWFIVLCGICKSVMVYTAGRYFILSGEHPMQAWTRLPGPRGWFPALLGGLSILCFPFWMGGLAGMLGTAMNWMFGLNHRPLEDQYLSAHLFGTAALLLAGVLTLIQSYRLLELLQSWIVGLLLLAILAAVAVAQVDWLEALRGLLTPVIPHYPAWAVQQYPAQVQAQTPLLVLVILMGAIGGGSYDYIGYLSLFREKGWGALGSAQARETAREAPPAPSMEPANLRRARQWLRAPVVDIFTGFVCVIVFTAAFNLLGASILNPKRLVPVEFDLLTPQVEFLTRIHPALRYLYQAGIFVAFWGTIYGALEIYSRTAYECFRPLVRRVRHTRYVRFRLPVCLYTVAGAAALMWTMRDPTKIVEPAALVGTITCGLWCFAMIWTDCRCLPPPMRMNGLWIVLNVAAGTALVCFGTLATLDYMKRFSPPIG